VPFQYRRCCQSGTFQIFKLYDLSRMTGLQAGATKQQLLRAMKGNTLAEAQLTGI
jgi:hypothetical protein